MTDNDSIHTDAWETALDELEKLASPMDRDLRDIGLSVLIERMVHLEKTVNELEEKINKIYSRVSKHHKLLHTTNGKHGLITKTAINAKLTWVNTSIFVVIILTVLIGFLVNILK